MASSCSSCCASGASRPSLCATRARTTACRAAVRRGCWWTGWSGFGRGSRTGSAAARRRPPPARCADPRGAARARRPARGGGPRPAPGAPLPPAGPAPRPRARNGQLTARLADPRTIHNSREQQEALRDGRAIVLITSGIHSNEVGGHLTPALLACRLASDTGTTTRRILDNVILLLVPSLNPDGVSIVTHWYNRTLGTAAEGTDPPELYHHYTGHDNNRDWYAFTQVETQLVVDSLHNVWHPEIVHDIHQQDTDGSRLFLPPYLDPVEPNVDPLLVDGVNALGADMAWQLAGEGKTGISINAIYD